MKIHLKILKFQEFFEVSFVQIPGIPGFLGGIFKFQVDSDFPGVLPTMIMIRCRKVNKIK